MPGTIQVTVLEFKGVSASPNPCANSLKVSVGRSHYHTWDKGEFSFPMRKLSENLVVALLDVGGNEIAHADIQTMQIVEKGYWDEVFSMNGGGHVHLKLRFVLSEEERNRIRIVRESAMKKKLETNLNINLRLSESVGTTHEAVEASTKNEHKISDSPKGFVEIDVVRPKVNDSQAGSSLTSATSSADPVTSYQNEGVISVKELSPSDTYESSQGAPYSSSGNDRMEIESLQAQETKPEQRTENLPIVSSMFLGSSITNNGSSAGLKSQDDPAQKSRNQGPKAKTPSNVMKMISAFENSNIQEVKSLKKAPSVPSQLNRFRKDGLFPMDKSLKKTPSLPSQSNRFRKEQLPADRSLTTFDDYVLDNTRQASTTVAETEPSESPNELDVNDSNIQPIEQTVKELDIPTEDLRRQSTSVIPTTSERLEEGQYQDTEYDKLYSETANSYEPSSAAEESGSGRGTSLKSSTLVKFEVDLNPKWTALDEYYSSQSSGMWIFSGNTRQLCCTTAGGQVIESFGDPQSVAETRRVNRNSSEPEVEEKNLIDEAEIMVGNNQKKIGDQTRSRCNDSPDDTSNGLFGQLIRVAVILGFGVLVLLTRQREPRKKQREENYVSPHIRLHLTE